MIEYVSLARIVQN